MSEAVVWGVVPLPDSDLQFPNPDTTGVPDGWSPVTTTSSDITIEDDDELVEDVRLTSSADIIVIGENATIRRCELLGGRIFNDTDPCGTGLLIEDTSVLATSPGAPVNDGEGVISGGSYTVRRCKIDGRSEGFRVGSNSICGPVTIEDSFARIVPPTPCGDWHGDGIQGYFAAGLTIDNMTIDMTLIGGCFGTAPVFYPDEGDGNTGTVAINRLLVMGQGTCFRLAMPGSVTNLKIVNDSWTEYPIDVPNCEEIDPWDAELVTIDSNYLITSIVGDQPCE